MKEISLTGSLLFLYICYTILKDLFAYSTVMEGSFGNQKQHYNVVVLRHATPVARHCCSFSAYNAQTRLYLLSDNLPKKKSGSNEENGGHSNN